ncbi:MAG: helix-turn-helix domain-containing protein [Thermodesulfobacteriota bacterium]|nr:helix-turn-helix domain-containing protein [Thermodesulfobacteriota bacterium]
MKEGRLTVGQYLKSQREAKRISLESVASITRIRLSTLQALEKDEFHLLPAEAFIRGFLRNYAKFIHLDPTDVIAAYQNQMEAKRTQALNEKLENLPSASFPTRFFKTLFDFLATLMGASPAFPVGRATFHPKD